MWREKFRRAPALLLHHRPPAALRPAHHDKQDRESFGKRRSAPNRALSELPLDVPAREPAARVARRDHGRWPLHQSRDQWHLWRETQRGIRPARYSNREVRDAGAWHFPSSATKIPRAAAD